MISSYSEALRKLARSAEVIGRADMLPALIEMADGLESMRDKGRRRSAGAHSAAGPHDRGNAGVDVLVVKRPLNVPENDRGCPARPMAISFAEDRHLWLIY